MPFPSRSLWLPLLLLLAKCEGRKLAAISAVSERKSELPFSRVVDVLPSGRIALQPATDNPPPTKRNE